MHQPAAFAQSESQALRELASEFPLATLIATFSGVPMINHVPMLWNGSELHGHIAKANELKKALENSATAVIATAVFHGPEGYISPADYPSKALHGKVVPTWNYAVAHITGTLQLRPDPQFIRQQIDQLTEAHEARANPDQPWSLDDAPPEFAQALSSSIVGIALQIETIEGKYKLSQNRGTPDRRGAAEGALARGNTALAELMQTNELPRS